MKGPVTCPNSSAMPATTPNHMRPRLVLTPVTFVLLAYGCDQIALSVRQEAAETATLVQNINSDGFGQGMVALEDWLAPRRPA